VTDKFHLTLCQGKYTYFYDSGKQTVLRYGEPWPAMDEMICGNKFVFSLAVEFDETLKALVQSQAREAQLRGALGYHQEQTRPIQRTIAALALPADDTALREWGKALLNDAARYLTIDAPWPVQLNSTEESFKALRGVLQSFADRRAGKAVL
jgi:hypothetical protein